MGGIPIAVHAQLLTLAYIGIFTGTIEEMSQHSQENGSETDLGSSPFKNIPDVDKQILEWASKLELETIQIRDTSEKLFAIVKQNIDELAASRKLFQTESENRRCRIKMS